MIDLEFIKDNLNNTSIARQILNVDVIEKGAFPKYEIASKITYLDQNFKVKSTSSKNYSSICIPMLEIFLNSTSSIDVIEYFKSTEEQIMAYLFNSFAPKKIPVLSLTDSIDFTKKEIYKADLVPKNVIVSKTVFDSLCSKLYLLPFSKIFTTPVNNILYDNISIYPLSNINDNLIITLADPYCLGVVSVVNKPYVINNIVSENINIVIKDQNALSFSYINNIDLNRVLSATGGHCSKCNMLDEYAPLDSNGCCICYKCYKPF